MIFVEMTRDPGIGITRLYDRRYLVTWNGTTWPVMADENGLFPIPAWGRG